MHKFNYLYDTAEKFYCNNI